MNQTTAPDLTIAQITEVIEVPAHVTLLESKNGGVFVLDARGTGLCFHDLREAIREIGHTPTLRELERDDAMLDKQYPYITA
jgi:hypothetical protein